MCATLRNIEVETSMLLEDLSASFWLELAAVLCVKLGILANRGGGDTD